MLRNIQILKIGWRLNRLLVFHRKLFQHGLGTINEDMERRNKCETKVEIKNPIENLIVEKNLM